TGATIDCARPGTDWRLRSFSVGRDTGSECHPRGARPAGHPHAIVPRSAQPAFRPTRNGARLDASRSGACNSVHGGIVAMMKTPTLMVQGTTSDAGKSLLIT